MNRLAAGLAASALATTATVFGFTGTAFATSPTCTATGEKPSTGGGNVVGYGDINCTATATFTLTTKLWRNNGNGTYSSWSNKDSNQVTTWESQGVGTPCVSGVGTRQWHSEAIISWKIYNGSSLQASGSSYNNSPDVNLNCH